jgi:hypothetical protein
MKKSIEIRDTRNGEWHWVNNSVTADPHLTFADKVVYYALCTFAGFKEIRPSFETIAECGAASLRVTKKSVKRLIEIGYVSIEVGGGRGLSNVYQLLKATKGCKICTVSKPCIERPETVQETTVNRAESAPHKDIEKDIYRKIAKTSVFANLNSIIKLFEGVNPTFERIYKNKTERRALEELIAKFGEEKITNLLKELPSIIVKKYAPRITTPLELQRDLGKLIAFVRQEKGKKIEIVSI